MQRPANSDDRFRPPPYPSRPFSERQAFRHPRTSLGVAGHWLHLAAVLSPLVIGEVIKDPEQKWRAIRLASVGTAIASEAIWTHRLIKKREEQEAREQERELAR